MACEARRANNGPGDMFICQVMKNQAAYVTPVASARRFSLVTELLVFVCFVGAGFSVATESAFGSCGHYVFTQLEWNSRQADLAAHSLLLNAGLPGPKPCHGPGCRQNNLPLTTVVPAPVTPERLEQLAVTWCSEPVTVVTFEREFPVAQPLNLQGVSQRMFRPPRV
jgi:hypothetical protein